MTKKPDIDTLIHERPDLFDAMDCRPGFDQDTGTEMAMPDFHKKRIAEVQKQREQAKKLPDPD